MGAKNGPVEWNRLRRSIFDASWLCAYNTDTPTWPSRAGSTSPCTTTTRSTSAPGSESFRGSFCSVCKKCGTLNLKCGTLKLRCGTFNLKCGTFNSNVDLNLKCGASILYVKFYIFLFSRHDLLFHDFSGSFDTFNLKCGICNFKCWTFNSNVDFNLKCGASILNVKF